MACRLADSNFLFSARHGPLKRLSDGNRFFPQSYTSSV
ncbi:hypothetical protein OROHE_022600 [Orobanche hederae]